MMTHETYKALTATVLVEAVGRDGLKRSIQAFPKALGEKCVIVGGLEAFRLHLPSFLGRRRGEDLADPEFGSSLHALFDMENELHASEIIQRVAQDEIPRRFGKYLDALHSFDVTVHRETRSLVVALELKPHGAERVSWNFELHFPVTAKQEHPPSHLLQSPWAMNDPRAVELIRSVRHFYPTGFPSWEDDDEESVPAYQRTPEYQRWGDAWEKALRRSPWKSFMHELRTAFPDNLMGIHTPAYQSACWVCCLYLKQSFPDGQQFTTRVAGAVSLIAPLYLVYTTTESRRSGETSTGLQPSFETEPTRWTRPYEVTMAQHIERVLGCQPFPLELADVPLPDLRVDHAHEPPTLLSALFTSRDGLLNLP